MMADRGLGLKFLVLLAGSRKIGKEVTRLDEPRARDYIFVGLRTY
jgi:hypothetical protein